MSLIYNKNINCNGTSQIEASKEGEMPITIMTMNADYNANGVNFHKSINNIDLYVANKETADADYAEFERNVYEALGVTIETTTTATK